MDKSRAFMVKVQHKGKTVGHTLIRMDYTPCELNGPFPDVVKKIRSALKKPDANNMRETPAISHNIAKVSVDWQGAFVSIDSRLLSIGLLKCLLLLLLKLHKTDAKGDATYRVPSPGSPNSLKPIVLPFSSTWPEPSILTILRSSLKMGKSYHHIHLRKRDGL